MRSRSHRPWNCRIARIVCAGVAAAIWLAGSDPGRAQQSRPLMPNDVQLAIMIKATLTAFNDANTTGNYTVLRDLASPEFQQENSPARLGELFRSQRAEGIDISPIVALPPRLWRPASIDPQGLLHLDGYFPSRPKLVSFALVFKEVAGRWRLHGLGTQFNETPVPPRPTGAADHNTAAASASPAEQIAQRTLPIQRFTGLEGRIGYWGWAKPGDQ